MRHKQPVRPPVNEPVRPPVNDPMRDALEALRSDPKNGKGRRVDTAQEILVRGLGGEIAGGWYTIPSFGREIRGRIEP